MSGVIRTVGGDLPAQLAGPVYVHEHLIIDSPLVAATMPHIHLDSVDEAVAEVRSCVAAGVRTMVDAMPAGAGRDPERLSRVSVLTGMRIVAATGLHTQRYYPDVAWAREEDDQLLAERFVADIEEGIDLHDYRGPIVERSEAKAGIVKVATLGEGLSAPEGRLFAAAAAASISTGAPMLTHTEGGLGGMAQIERLVSLGVDPDRVALSHTDKTADRGYHADLLETGVYLCYDQALRQPETTFALLEAMIDAGKAERLLLGTDGARRSMWATTGGSPGLASLYRDLTGRLGPETAETVFEANPARFLTLRR
jgi:predicted metal-dependent phosphotriesterase family hydrolase